MEFLLTKQGSGELSQEDKNRLKEYKQDKNWKNEELSKNLEPATGVLGTQLTALQNAIVAADPSCSC